MKKTILATSIAALATPAFAGGIDSGADLTLSGGFGAGYYNTTNTGSSNNDNFQVTDFMLELSAEPSDGVGFTAGFGTMAAITVTDGGVGNVPYLYGFQYGWATVAPMEGVSIEAGMLATNIGYEVAYSLANPHATIAGIWAAQPVYYPGARVNYAMGDLGLYAEINQAGGGSPQGWTVGASGSVAGLDYAVNYRDGDQSSNLLDIILATKVAGMDVAVNLDYTMLDNAPTGQDDTALGTAIYVVPSFGAIDVPVRVEFMNDGTSGVYGGVDSATTFTVTPTFAFSENALVRAEFSMVNSTNKIFADENGVAQDSKTSFAVQAVYTF